MTLMKFAKYILLFLIICTSCNRDISKPLDVLVIHSYNISSSNSIKEINKGIEQAFKEENLNTNIKHHYLSQNYTEKECMESVKELLSKGIEYDIIFCEHDRAALSIIKNKLNSLHNTIIVYSGLLYKDHYINDIDWASTNQFFFYNKADWEKIYHIIDILRALNIRIIKVNNSISKYISAELYHNYKNTITKFHNLTKLKSINLSELKYIDFVNNNYYKEMKFILLDILTDYDPIWSKLISVNKNPGLTFQLSNIGLEERSILGSYTCTPFNQGYEPAKYIALYKKNKINYSREQKLSQQYILNWEIIELINNELFYNKDFTKMLPNNIIYTHRPWVKGHMALSIFIIILIILVLTSLVYFIIKTNKDRKKIKLLQKNYKKSKLLSRKKEESYAESFFSSMGSLNNFAFLLNKEMLVINSNNKTIKKLGIENYKNGSYRLAQLIELIDPKTNESLLNQIGNLRPIMALKLKFSNKLYYVSGFYKSYYNNNILILNDITERLKHDRILNLSLIDNDFIYWIYNKTTNTFLISKEIIVDGKSKNELNFKEITKIVSIKDLKRIFKDFKEVIKDTSHKFTTKVKLNINNTSSWWEIRISLDKKGYNQIEGIYGACINISNYIRYIQELDSHREELLRSDKLKSAFIANMSHEIRTPLNAIVGFSNIITDSEEDLSESDKKTFTQSIMDNSDSLLMLIDDIINISENGSEDLHYNDHPISLKSIITKVEKVSQLIIKENIELIIKNDIKDCLINVDPLRLNQVIMNLVTNAIKFTKEGSITIAYKIEEKNLVKIYIKDTGIGITEKAIPQIFDRFYKEKHNDGTGIGLSLCKTITEHYNGTITCESELGKGSTFTLTLPTII